MLTRRFLRSAAPAVIAMSAVAAAGSAGAESITAAHVKQTGQAAEAQAEASSGGHAMTDALAAWPKIGFETVGAVEYGGMSSKGGAKDRGPDVDVRFESTALIEFNDALQLDALFQYKSKQPRALTDPDRELFSNQGSGRRNGGRFKELYLRYGDWRAGKFVQDFGRGFDQLPGLFATDLVEEPDDGYEPSEVWGVEKLHVYDNENGGWRQISFAAFMRDRTFLNETFPYNVGRIHYRDGGIGNTKLPENLMVTWDNINMPVGHWAHLSYQLSVIRWGKSYQAQKGEWWTTANADLSIPLRGSVADTLRGRYGQLHLFVEGARRDNFDGVDGRTRQFLSLSSEYLSGPWAFDLTTTQRWTDDKITGRQKDELYTTTLGYALPSDTVIGVSVAQETVDGRKGVYAGLRLTQTLTSCNRCLAKGRFY